MMKNKWRQEELDALEKEMIEHGTNWKTILLFDGLPDGPLKYHLIYLKRLLDKGKDFFF